MSKNFRASTSALLRDDPGFPDMSSLLLQSISQIIMSSQSRGGYESTPVNGRGKVPADRRGQGIDGTSTAAGRSFRGRNLPSSA